MAGRLIFILKNGFIRKYTSYDNRVEDNIYVYSNKVIVDKYFNTNYVSLMYYRSTDPIILTTGLYTLFDEPIIEVLKFYNKDLADFMIEVVNALMSIDNKSDDQLLVDYYCELIRRMCILREHLQQKNEELTADTSELSFNRSCKSAR